MTCLICAKHRDLDALPGGAIAADGHAVLTHLPLGSQESVYLGYLMVEARRHVPGLGDLTADEAASVGRLASGAARALTQVTGAEHVYAAVIGHGVEHFHMHVIPRYPGTPREYWWTRVDEWPDAPRGGAPEIAALTRRLRSLL